MGNTELDGIGLHCQDASGNYITVLLPQHGHVHMKCALDGQSNSPFREMYYMDNPPVPHVMLTYVGASSVFCGALMYVLVCRTESGVKYHDILFLFSLLSKPMLCASVGQRVAHACVPCTRGRAVYHSVCVVDAHC